MTRVRSDRRRPGTRPLDVTSSALLAALLLLAPAGALVEASDPPLFRIFLTDGSSLSSYGEFAQVGDRIVFSLPLGPVSDPPRLHLATVPADAVDWPATARYGESVRASHYAATRGEADYAALTADVTRVLNEIALATDKNVQLSLAELARRQIAEWPRRHFGFKSAEVRQIVGLLDEVVSELRFARGERRFDLTLVASVMPPERMPLLPRPTLQESIEQTLRLSRLTRATEERRALLETARGLLDHHLAALPSAWRAATRSSVVAELEAERAIDRSYTVLRARTYGMAMQAAARADVRGVERAIALARLEDARLGGRRPEVVDALLGTLNERLDSARRLRLARDQWNVKARVLTTYGRAVKKPLGDLARSRPLLEDIRMLAGPDSESLEQFERRLARMTTHLHGIVVPADASASHAVLNSGLQLATNAVRLRQAAVSSNDLHTAWEASTAAAGALMLLDRARADLARVLEPPRLQ
jgi:hypothetical protein